MVEQDDLSFMRVIKRRISAMC